MKLNAFRKNVQGRCGHEYTYRSPFGEDCLICGKELM